MTKQRKLMRGWTVVCDAILNKKKGLLHISTLLISEKDAQAAVDYLDGRLKCGPHRAVELREVRREKAK